MFEAYSDEEKKKEIKKVRHGPGAESPFLLSLTFYCLHSARVQTNGIFELRIKSSEGTEGVWTIDLKNAGSVYKGTPKPNAKGTPVKPNVTLLMADDTFVQLAEGKVRACSLAWMEWVGMGADGRLAPMHASLTARRRS